MGAAGDTIKKAQHEESHLHSILRVNLLGTAEAELWGGLHGLVAALGPPPGFDARYLLPEIPQCGPDLRRKLASVYDKITSL
jgi:hypothetical protein